MNIETKTKRKFVWIVGLACLFGVLAVTSAQAQVKVGTNPTTIDARSILELESDNQALYLPRLSAINLAAVNNWQEGMVVYNTDHDCIQIFNGTAWNCVDTDNDGIYDGSGDLISTVDVRQANFDMTFTNTGGDFIVDTTTLVVDASENRVGLGTTSPTSMLELRGDGANTSSNNPILTLRENGSGGGAFYIGSLRDGAQNRLAIGEGTNEYLTIGSDLNAGNVGIGTTTPNSTLDVNGSAAFSTASMGGSNYTLDAGTRPDRFVINPSTANHPGNITLTLPPASGHTGRVLTIINANQGAGAIGFSRSIVGSLTHVNPGASISLISDGASWYIYSSF